MSIASPESSPAYEQNPPGHLTCMECGFTMFYDESKTKTMPAVCKKEITLLCANCSNTDTRHLIYPEAGKLITEFKSDLAQLEKLAEQRELAALEEEIGIFALGLERDLIDAETFRVRKKHED